MSYEFDAQRISQHIMKFCVDVRPGFNLNQDRADLQAFANWLIETHPALFETLLCGPQQCQVKKSFALNDGKTAQVATFALAPRGPVFTVPRRLFVGAPSELGLDSFAPIFVEALKKLTLLFPGRLMPRVGIVHELIFDTNEENSLGILARGLSEDRWQENLRNVQIVLETVVSGKSVGISMRPTFQSPVGAKAAQTPERKYGLIVNAEISINQPNASITEEQILDLLRFSSFYVPQELIVYLGSI